MPTEDFQLELGQTTLVLRETHHHSEHTYALPPDNVEPAVLVCPSCDFQTINSLGDHQKHHEEKYDFHCPLCSYSVSEEVELNFHLLNHHSKLPFAFKDGLVDDGEPSLSPDLSCSALKSQHTPKGHIQITTDQPSSSCIGHIHQEENDDNEIHLDEKCQQISSHVKKEKKRSSRLIYRCDDCLYEGKSEKVLNKHRQLHVKKSEYQCTICSYSVSVPQHLHYHMKNYHSQQDQDQAPPIVKKQSLRCDQCLYESQSEEVLNKHRQLHLEESEHQCTICSYSVSMPSKLYYHMKNHHTKEDQDRASPIVKKLSSRLRFPCDQCLCECRSEKVLNQHRQLHLEKSEHQCTICSYSVNELHHLYKHIKNHHTQQDQAQALPIEKKPPSGLMLKCDQCLYKSVSEKVLKKHIQFHVKKSKHQCTRCSYSVSVPHQLTHHMKHQHAKLDLVESDTNSGEDYMPKSKRVKRRHGNQGPAFTPPNDDLVLDSPQIQPADACHSPSLEPERAGESTTLSDDLAPPTESSNLDEEERICRYQLAQLEEGFQSDRRSLEQSSNQLMELKEKTQSLRKRVEAAEKNEQITEKILDDVLVNLNEVEEKKTETSIKKMRMELELRTEQCKALQLEMIEPNAVEEDHQQRVASVQKKVQSLEKELEKIEKESAELVVLEEAITGDLYDAEECCLGASRSLSTLKTELEEVESGWKVDANCLNQMVDSSKERIRVYHQLQERLMKMAFMKKRDHLNKKKTKLLPYLKTQFSED